MCTLCHPKFGDGKGIVMLPYGQTEGYRAYFGWFRPGRYKWKAKKYFRMNPLRLWWLGHVWDDIHRDWLHRNGYPCKLGKKGECLICP